MIEGVFCVYQHSSHSCFKNMLWGFTAFISVSVCWYETCIPQSSNLSLLTWLVQHTTIWAPNARQSLTETLRELFVNTRDLWIQNCTPIYKNKCDMRKSVPSCKLSTMCTVFSGIDVQATPGVFINVIAIDCNHIAILAPNASISSQCRHQCSSNLTMLIAFLKKTVLTFFFFPSSFFFYSL